MKVVILAGGMGTRLSEETGIKPKPMVEIGERPMIWHIMKLYSHYGFNDFVACLGYKGYHIKEYFANYFVHRSDMTIDLQNNKREIHGSTAEPWKVTLVDTGADTMTGGRIKRIKNYIGDETFMLTYGDGLSNVNIEKLLSFHREHGKLATITSIQPLGRFGAMQMSGDNVVETFFEKPRGDGSWVNGGFFVLEPKIFDYIEGDNSIWERKPLEGLAKDGQLVTYKHHGFWACMDTLKEKTDLEEMWSEGRAEWKVWK